jgi:hypothetical protein
MRQDEGKMDANDEPLILRHFTYDDAQQTARFAFIGSRKGVALAVSGMTPVKFSGDPRQSETDKSIKIAIKGLLEEALAAMAE